MALYARFDYTWEASILWRGEQRRVRIICNDNPLKAGTLYNCADLIHFQGYQVLGKDIFNARLHHIELYYADK